MKIQNTFRIVALTALAALVLNSCGTKQAKEAEELETVSKEQAFEGVTNYPIPTSFEVIQMINKAGASYILSICNPVDNANKITMCGTGPFRLATSIKANACSFVKG